MMKLVQLLLLSGVVSVMSAGTASAVRIAFQLDTVVIEGGLLPTTQTYDPDLPIIGAADIDFGAGTGFVALVNHSIYVDLQNNGNDARLDISGWRQNITSIDGDGNITSTGQGSIACTNLGGLGATICSGTSPDVAGWPTADYDATWTSSAVIDTGAQTITVIDNSARVPAGTMTATYSYTIIPEPATALLMGAGLIGLTVFGSRQRA